VRFDEIAFLEVEEADRIHTRGIDAHGGDRGLRDPGLRESAVMAPRSGYYRSLAEMAAVLCHGLAKNHAYLDGNKRVAISAASVFLGLNGHAVELEEAKWHAIVVGVATGSVSRDELTNHFADEMGGDPVLIKG